MVVKAVVYIPQSTFAGKFNNTGNFKIGTALIARSLDVDINPNLDGSPVIGEDDVRHTNGDVIFTAKIAGQEWTSTQVVFPALAEQRNRRPGHQVLGHQEVTTRTKQRKATTQCRSQPSTSLPSSTTCGR